METIQPQEKSVDNGYKFLTERVAKNATKLKKLGIDNFVVESL